MKQIIGNNLRLFGEKLHYIHEYITKLMFRTSFYRTDK